MNKIKNAIIIHGPGRSGTTLLSNILSLHPDFYWISGYVNKYPNLQILSIFNNFQRIPFFEKLNRGKKKFPRPAEAYNFWKYYFNQFNIKGANPEKKQTQNAIRAIHRINKYSIGNRFITKLTGASRFEIIDSIFEKPTIIWIDRNPESVIMSYYKQKWNYKSKPAAFNNKSKAELIQEYCNDFININEEKKKLQKYNFIQVYYEDLISKPEFFFINLCKSLNLELNHSFLQKINNWHIYQGSNESYKELLNAKEQKLLQTQLFEISKSLGY